MSPTDGREGPPSFFKGSAFKGGRGGGIDAAFSSFRLPRHARSQSQNACAAGDWIGFVDTKRKEIFLPVSCATHQTPWRHPFRLSQQKGEISRPPKDGPRRKVSLMKKDREAPGCLRKKSGSKAQSLSRRGTCLLEKEKHGNPEESFERLGTGLEKSMRQGLSVSGIKDLGWNGLKA